jgi:hypothetical protein
MQNLVLRFQQDAARHVQSIQGKIPIPPATLVSPEDRSCGNGSVRGNTDVPPQNNVLNSPEWTIEGTKKTLTSALQKALKY